MDWEEKTFSSCGAAAGKCGCGRWSPTNIQPLSKSYRIQFTQPCHSPSEGWIYSRCRGTDGVTGKNLDPNVSVSHWMLRQTSVDCRTVSVRDFFCSRALLYTLLRVALWVLKLHLHLHLHPKSIGYVRTEPSGIRFCLTDGPPVVHLVGSAQ